MIVRIEPSSLYFPPPYFIPPIDTRTTLIFLCLGFGSHEGANKNPPHVAKRWGRSRQIYPLISFCPNLVPTSRPSVEETFRWFNLSTRTGWPMKVGHLLVPPIDRTTSSPSRKHIFCNWVNGRPACILGARQCPPVKRHLGLPRSHQT